MVNAQFSTWARPWRVWREWPHATRSGSGEERQVGRVAELAVPISELDQPRPAGRGDDPDRVGPVFEDERSVARQVRRRDAKAGFRRGEGRWPALFRADAGMERLAKQQVAFARR